MKRSNNFYENGSSFCVDMAWLLRTHNKHKCVIFASVMYRYCYFAGFAIIEYFKDERVTSHKSMRNTLRFGKPTNKRQVNEVND